MKDKTIETIMNICALYLKLGEVTMTSSVIQVTKDYILRDNVADQVFLREEILKKLLQELHSL